MKRTKLMIILSVVLVVAVALTLTLTLTLCDKKLEKVELKEATCTEEGMSAHYKDKDGNLYEDEKGKIAVTKEDLVIAKIALEKVEKVAETCVTDGVKEHYKCPKCGKVFMDASGTIETTKEALKIDKHGLKKVEEVPATTTTTGTKEHWVCETCNKIFKDSEGKTETTLEDLKIELVPKTQATFAFNEGVLTKTYNGKDFSFSPDDYTTNSDGQVKIEFEYGSKRTETVKSAKTYKVYITIEESDLYLPYSGEFEFVMNKLVLGEKVINKTFEYGNSSLYYITLTKADLPDLCEEQLEIEVDLETTLPGTFNNVNATDVDYDFSNVTFNITVNKVTTTFAFNDGVLTKTYNGKDFALSSGNYKTNSDGKVTFEYYEGTSKLANAPKYGGSYKVKVMVASTDVYTAYEKTFDITINKLKLAKKEVVFKSPYNGQKEFSMQLTKDLCPDTIDEYQIKFKTASPDAGVYVMSSYTIGKEYFDSYDFSDVTFKLEITKIKPEIKLNDSVVLSKEYDGKLYNDLKASDVTTNSDGKVYFYWCGEDYKRLSRSPVNQGKYYLEIGTTVGKNYGGAFIYKEFTISPKKLPTQTIEIKAEYNGKTKFAKSMLKVNMEGIVDPFVYIEFETTSPEIGKYNSKDVTYLSNGTRMADYVKLNNYDMSDVTINVEITKIDLNNGGMFEEPAVDYNGKKTFTFKLTPEEHSDMLYEGDTVGVTVTITTSSEVPGYYESDSTDGHTASYTVDNDKYYMSGVCLIINKISAELKFTENSSLDKDYDGQKITDEQVGKIYTISSYDEVIMWSKDGGFLLDKPMYPGVYTLTIKVAANDYFEAGEITKEVKISPKEINISLLKVPNEGALEGNVTIPPTFVCGSDSVKLTITFPTTAKHGLENYKVVSQKTYDLLKQAGKVADDILVGTLTGESAYCYNLGLINIKVANKIIKT